ncbi:4-(cytidine 5'-diphospho)-2-C-methyl-D-erythritol kinase [Swaminathania salitolerans]|uniref:4-diphosphocytidyl-2-C-methyl-D-erythritol kinase n=1 Tax=Swaminathania salitolerans TaxID=182838 RepID=A0A511BQH6_9PROT|nr:4-(cytidine 5'-diphospho)-2-C-methyl-D-erythritol kinase [Swaminathania salitolerans]GBQ11715.1 4-diphosphocytidyl-2-C-methyl-D-erythritol kinase [Swaminathania salitolerans LMG 21291]GEL02597.1 4-diphosphocytidyl-2-C-methyl-D-erythritol kinase [Swaminathania salitolerans]
MISTAPPDHAPAHAHAKINLFLHVTGRRADGYHELDSLAVFAASHDSLRPEERFAEGRAVTLAIEGPFAEGLDAGGDNLVLRAASALAAAAGRPVPGGRLRLTKSLPVASGIGGGSADAAAALRLLAALWHLPDIDLPALAATLGADVPVCVAQEARRMQGVGEILSPAPRMPPLAMLLVNPGIAVPTPAVFRAWKESGAAFRPAATLPRAWNDVESLVDTLGSTSNDLELPAIALYPLIGEVLNDLRQARTCLFARMSGSGATCFGLYPDLDAAESEARRMRARGYWAEAGQVGSGAD